MNIYVSHLSWGTSSEGLGNLFMQFGEVASANVITDRETGRSRGFGLSRCPMRKRVRRPSTSSTEPASRVRRSRSTWLVPARSALRAATAAIAEAVTAATVAEATAATAAVTVATGTNSGFYFRTDLRESVSPHTIRSGAVFTAPFFVFPYFPHAQRHREKERKITRGTSVFPEKSDNLPP